MRPKRKILIDPGVVVPGRVFGKVANCLPHARRIEPGVDAGNGNIPRGGMQKR
jgi:hypothetical protein